MAKKKKILKVKITNSISISASDVSRKKLIELKKEFSVHNPEYYKIKGMGFSTRGIKPVYQLYEHWKGRIWFPRGLMDKLKKLLPDFKFKVKDERIEVSLNKKVKLKSGFKFWESQINAINISVIKEQGIIHGVCGSGKTEILLGIFERLQQKTLVIVDKLELMKQWVSRINKRFTNINVGEIGGGKWKIGRDITIGSQQTLIKHVDKIRNEFGIIIADEVHHFSSPSFLELISKLNAKYRIGASATLKRKDRKEFLMFAAFGDILYKITDEDLSKKGKIFITQFIVIPTNFKSELYVQEKKKLDGEIEYYGYNFHALLGELKEDKERNELILKFIKREVKNGHKCLIMADRVSHCIYFRNLLLSNNISAGMMVGEKEYENERKKAPELLKQGKFFCIVVSPLVREGFDLPELDRAFIINPSASNELKIQQQSGRVKRIAKGKKDAKVYYFWDKEVVGFDRHIKLLQKLFKNLKIYREK